MRKITKRPLTFYLHITLFVVAGVGVTGCFMQPPPPDRAIPDDTPDPFIDNFEIVEPVIEEPIREVGDEPVVEEDVEVPVEEFGDLNNDGVLDDSDLEAFRNSFGNFGDDELANSADLDGDGQVTLIDFQMFLTLASQAEEE